MFLSLEEIDGLLQVEIYLYYHIVVGFLTKAYMFSAILNF